MKLKYWFLYSLMMTSVISWGQKKVGNFIAAEGAPLSLNRYGTNVTREIRQGTFLKVYKYDEKVHPGGNSEAKGLNKLNSVLTGKVMSKGQYFKVSGDSLVLVHRGNPVYIDIDEIVMIKQYFSPFRRIVGSAINAFGLYGLTLGSALGVAGIVTAVEGDGNGFGALFFFSGVIVGGAGYLVHKLGLLFRRNKYDMAEVWYVRRNVTKVQ